MKSVVWFRAAAVGVAALLLTAAYKRAEPSSVMADAANAFLNSLWPDQKAKASYAFDDDERLSWHFVPTGANYKPGDRSACRRPQPAGCHQSSIDYEPRAGFAAPRRRRASQSPRPR